MRALLTALAIFAFTACAPVQLLRPVPPDGGGWRELRTDHFVLRTDLPSGRARGLVAELEEVVDGLHRGLFGERPKELSIAVDVVAFASRRDVDLFLPANVQAAASFDARWSRPTIIMTGAFGELQRAVVAHELTHVLMAASYARQPLWFKEGVACYAETMDWEGPSRKLTLGRVPAWRRWNEVRPPAAALRELLLASGRLDPPQYSLAWGLAHFLVHQHYDAFESLQERFAGGEEPLEAWRAIFPQWDPEIAGGAERLRDEVWRYLSAELHYYRLQARKREASPSFNERMLSEGEVHDIRLGLRWLNRGRPVPGDAFAAELDSALASGSVVAAWIRGHRAPAERLALAERATREHPADARAWLLLATAAPEPARVETALERAVAVDPASAAARSALSRYLVHAGKPQEALSHANEAVRLAPWSPSALDALAAVAQALGRCPEALGLQRRAVENIGESDRTQLERYLDRLGSLERSCGAPGGAGSPGASP